MRRLLMAAVPAAVALGIFGYLGWRAQFKAAIGRAHVLFPCRVERAHAHGEGDFATCAVGTTHFAATSSAFAVGAAESTRRAERERARLLGGSLVASEGERDLYWIPLGGGQGQWTAITYHELREYRLMVTYGDASSAPADARGAVFFGSLAFEG